MSHTVRRDKQGRIWMLVGNAPADPEPEDPLTCGIVSPDHARGRIDVKRERHVSVDEVLDGMLGIRPTMDKLMRDIRIRTAKQLLERSHQKAYVFYSQAKDFYILKFISDHEDDDHELAKTLAPEINRIIHDDDEYFRLYEVI